MEYIPTMKEFLWLGLAFVLGFLIDSDIAQASEKNIEEIADRVVVKMREDRQ